MTNSSLFKKLLLSIGFIAALTSCDKDFDELGSDIIDSDIHHNDIARYYGKVTAYDAATGVVQSNNLPVNSLGIYNTPAFGRTVASFVTQVGLVNYNPVFGNNPIIDSVYIHIPYYSTKLTTEADGTGTYRLDSIYGNLTTPMKLKMYRNGFFLRNSEPGASVITSQKYYSNDRPLIDANKSDLLYENNEFLFSNAEVQRKVTISGVESVKERFAPGIFTYLDVDYFKRTFFDDRSKLANENIFREYFRGLYFNIESDVDGALAQINLAEARITIIYREDYTNPTNVNDIERVRKTLVMNLSGNTVNFFENTPLSLYASALASANTVEGDEALYLKGGEGSMAIIDILDTADLNLLRRNDANGNRVLINEANLSFYVDEAKMGAATTRPWRVYLYDLKNKRPIIDYLADNSTGTTTKFDKGVHGGIFRKDSLGNWRYKIRITNHLNNILNKDSTNVKLGLVVTENINLISNVALKTAFDAGTTTVREVPTSAIMNPLGIVLYGSNPNVPENKRVKLEIFYTKPN